MTTLSALANPIWLAATTRQQHLAYGNSAAMRFYKEVVPLAAIRDHSPESIAALTALVAPRERVWFFEEPPQLNPTQWRESRRIPGYLMVLDRLPPEHASKHADRTPSVILDPVSDIAAMQALKAIAFPGFFGARTPEMGRYRGIRVRNGDGQPELVAMAGERLATPGAREVSAVCTHPAHTGRGYAQQLTREATAAILADGDLPFLHVAGANERAIRVYEALGFVRHRDAVFVQIERLLKS